MLNCNERTGWLWGIAVMAAGFPGCTSTTPGINWAMGGTGSLGGSGNAGPVCMSYTATTSSVSQWEQLNGGTTLPQVRFGSAAVYVAARDTLVLFGGTDRSTSYNDVRVLANASSSGSTAAWSLLPTAGTAPSPRANSIAGYSAAQDTLFIFGGVDGSNKLVSDLWKLSNVTAGSGTPTWSNVAITGPALNPIRGQMSGVYEETTDTLIFFGGINCQPSLCTQFNDTYALKGLSGQPYWQTVATAGGAPPGRYLHSSVYDLASDSLIIFGGNATTSPSGDATANLNDAWILAGAFKGTPTWRAIASGSSASPPALMGQSAVYDQSNGRMMVFGGVDTKNMVTRATWILTGLRSTTQNWFEYDTGTPLPSSRSMHVAAYAGTASNRMLVFGGDNGGRTYANDTWVLHNANGLASKPPAKITITSATTTLCASNWVKLTATVTDASGSALVGSILVWKSSDDSVATVDAEGLVTGIAVGTVTITVTDESGSVVGSITLKVTPSAYVPPVTGNDAGSSKCTCYCGWPANQTCTTNTDCPDDTSEPGTLVPGVCGCPVNC